MESGEEDRVIPDPTVLKTFSPEEARAWLTFVRIMLRLSYEMNRELKLDSDISLSDFHVLNALVDAQRQRMAISPLATRIGWERSRVSHQVKRMSRRQLVAIEPAGANDRRASDVVLTAHGMRVYADSAAPHLALVRNLFLDAIEEERLVPFTKDLASILERIMTKGTLPRPEFPSI